MTTRYQIALVREKARAMRHDVVNMIGCDNGKVGHLGGSCSCADIVAALYFYKMDFAPEKPDRDRFLLSKGHAALVQYAALAEAGLIDKSALSSVKTIGGKLQGHPDKNKTVGVEANTGSLGQGLSLGLGMAMGQKAHGWRGKTYVLIGDGEAAEGQIWEAAQAASAYHADKLVGILDKNGYQATSSVKAVLDTGDLNAKFRAFGWHTIEIDGHDADAICDAFDAADGIKERPVMIICDTVKGKGVSFAENTAAFHNAGLTKEQFDAAHKSIDCEG